MINTKKTLKIVFAGGGTGGHVFPALNIARAMKERWDCQIHFIGTQRGIEAKKVPEAGFPISFIPVAGFQRHMTLKNLSFPLKLWQSMRICKQELKQIKPDLVIGTGGYVMGPVLKTAIKMGILTVIQEQNSFPGLTTRMLSNKADLIFLAYEEAKQYLKDVNKTVVCGNPISLQVANENRAELCRFFGLDETMQTVLVFGGSQGSAAINRGISKLLKENELSSAQLLWQTGQREFDKFQNYVKKSNFKNVNVLPFINEMNKAYAVADFAVCRAGAMTLSELMAAGLPAVLVPLPIAAADHQFKNAGAVAAKNGAVVVKEGEQFSENLNTAIHEMLSDKNKLESMSRNMAALYDGDPLPQILDSIAGLLNKN